MPIPVTIDAALDYVLKEDEELGRPIFLIGAISDPAYSSALARYKRIQRKIAARAMRVLREAETRNGATISFPTAMTEEEEAALPDEVRAERAAQHADAVAAYSEIAGEIEMPEGEAEDMARAISEICGLGIRGWRDWMYKGRAIDYEMETTAFGGRLSDKSLSLIDVDNKIELAQAIIDRNELSEKQRGN